MSKKKDHIRVCRMKTNSQLRLSASTKQQQKMVLDRKNKY